MRKRGRQQGAARMEGPRTLMKWILCIAACSAYACGGAQGIQASIDQLKVRQDVAQKRLDRTLARVSEAEERQRLAAKQAHYSECRAQVMGLAAEAAQHVSACQLKIAGEAECHAHVAKSQADGTLLGCLFGIGLSAITGGAAVPVALAGCGLGRMAGESESSCARADCDGSEPAAQQFVLDAHHLPTVPMCGGELGATISASGEFGVRVDSVDASSKAAKLGLADDDVLVAVNEILVPDADAVQSVVQSLPAGSNIRLQVRRDGKSLNLSGPLDEMAGVQFGGSELVGEVSVRITAVRPGSGADRAGLSAGDRIARIGVAPLISVALAYGLVALAQEGTAIQLTYERAGVLTDVAITLGPRSDPHAF